jgi:hypothetical protein
MTHRLLWLFTCVYKKITKLILNYVCLLIHEIEYSDWRIKHKSKFEIFKQNLFDKKCFEKRNDFFIAIIITSLIFRESHRTLLINREKKAFKDN